MFTSSSSGQVDALGRPGPARWSPDERLGPGGLFGFSSMLTERSIGPRAVAAGPTEVALIPASAVLARVHLGQGARYLAEHMSAAIPVRAELGPTYSLSTT